MEGGVGGRRSEVDFSVREAEGMMWWFWLVIMSELMTRSKVD
jgi:hypothetical protein